MQLLVAFMAIFVASILVPRALIGLLSVNVAAVLGLSALQLCMTLFPHYRPRRRHVGREPFVSIIVPAHDEPPVVLMHTLEALSHLDYERFEVIVIDNNTTDPALWKPVERFSKHLGPKFRFTHVENLTGFKAGAINYVLPQVYAKSEYVAIVDADYVVTPEFLSTAMSYFTEDDIALVQFPQEYRNSGGRAAAVVDEYRHYFKIYMNMGNHLDCVPATGTVSVYRRNALIAIEGFRSEALTEDADVGLRLYAAGYRGVYVDRVVGHGLIPYDLASYRKQKSRWAFGNAQSALTLLSMFGRIRLRSWIGFAAHLSAWNHLNFVPLTVLAAYAIVASPIVDTTAAHKLLLDLASVCIFATILSKLVLFLATFRDQRNAISRAMRAFLVHMGMTLVYSEACMQLAFRKRVGFARTSKFVSPHVPSFFKSSYRELFLGVWFLAATLDTAIFGGRIITIAAFATSSLTLLAIYYVYWSLSKTKSESQQQLVRLEARYHRHLRTGLR